MKKRIQHSREDILLATALKHIGLKFWRDPKSWDVKITDKSGKHEFDCCTEVGDWVETSISSVEALGKTKTFVRSCLVIWISNERFSNTIENPFFGVKCAEELSVRLDLIVPEEKKENDNEKSCKNS